ncbi:DUF3822 family protein [Marinilabiliaceae bacterium JC017]|nr:DUF3822 family protein [Marinilabiliaceae bacterium JC017]
MTSLFVVDDTFDKNITSSYFLSIQISLDGLSFCILDPVRNNYILFKHLPFKQKDVNWSKTQELLLTEEILSYSYKKTFVVFNTTRATIIPGALYHKDKITDVINFTHAGNQEATQVISNKIRMLDAWNVFAIPEFLYHLLKNQFQDISLYQQFTPMIESNLIMASSDKGEYVLQVNIQEGFFDIVVLHKHHLQLCNSFRYTNDTDFVYYVLLAFEQLKLTQDQTDVFISGIESRQNPYFLLLKKYLRKTKLITPSRHFDYSNAYKNISKEKYYNLLNISSCV